MTHPIASDAGQLATLRVHAADNVRVALQDLPQYDSIPWKRGVSL